MSDWDKPQILLNVRTGDATDKYGIFENYGVAIDFLKTRPDVKGDHVPVVTTYDTEAYKRIHNL